MKKYTYQSFLLNCSYNNIDLESYKWDKRCIVPDYRIKRNLLDCIESGFYRCVSLTELDRDIDTLDDLKKKVVLFKELDLLIIVDDRSDASNIHIQAYAEATLKSYIWLLHNNGIKCQWVKR